jgi:hypothetical protein
MKKRAAAKPDCIRGGCASWPVKASLRHQYTKKIGRLFRKPGFSAASAAAASAASSSAASSSAAAAGADRALRGGRDRPLRGF